MSSSNIFLVNKRPSVVSVEGALDVHGAPVVLNPPGQPNDSRECPADVANHPNVKHLIDIGWIDVESGQASGKRKATAGGDPQGQSKDMMNMDAPEPPPAPLAGNPPGNTAPANEQQPWNANQDAGDPPPAPMAGNPPGLTAPPSPESDDEEEEVEEDDGKGGKKKTMKKKAGKDDKDTKKSAQPGGQQQQQSGPGSGGMWPATGQMATGQNQVSMAPAPAMSPEQQAALRRQTAPNIDDSGNPMQSGTPEAVRAANAVRRIDGDDHHFADAADATTAKLGMQQATGPTGGYAGSPANADTAATDARRRQEGESGTQQPAASDARKAGGPAAGGDEAHFADAGDATAAKIGQPTIAKGNGGNGGKNDPEADAKFAKEQEEMEKKLSAEEEAKKKGNKGHEGPKSWEKDVSKGHDKDDKKK